MAREDHARSPWQWLAPFLGASLVLLLWANDAVQATKFPGLLINSEAIWGRDFANVWSGGRMLLGGDLSPLYRIDLYQDWQRSFLDPRIDHHNYSYPPTSLLYVGAFGALPYLFALALWLSLSAIAFVIAARPWLRDAGIGSAWSLFLPTTALCLWAGHYGLFFGALWLWAWRAVDRDQRAAGIATGLMIIKPHLALLMPLLLALKGAWRAFAWAALTVGALVGASILLFGAEPWRTYLTATSGTQLSLVDDVGTYFALMMPSAVTNALALGASPLLAWALQGLAALIAFVLLRRAPRDAASLCFVGAIATFLILPYGFNYDLTVVGLAALLLSHQAFRDRDWLRFAIAGLALILPPAMLYMGRWDIRVAPIILLALLYAAVSSGSFNRSPPPHGRAGPGSSSPLPS